MRNSKFAEARGYTVLNASEARTIAAKWLRSKGLNGPVVFGLPEIHGRTDVWIVPMLSRLTEAKLGEIAVDARSACVDEAKTTKRSTVEMRLNDGGSTPTAEVGGVSVSERVMRPGNTVACGDAELLARSFPAQSIDLVFTSPPYFSAKPEYAEYVSYEHYLGKMRRVVRETRRILRDGRFFVINSSPIILRRSRRQQSSTRVPIPFDLHRIFMEEGFEFIDDIIWEKPEGAGWALGRGRRFAADRNPLQYKPAVVTEYVMVYRKRSERLIDHYIRTRDARIIRDSKILGDYDRTNIWRIKPAHDPRHPAVFPLELAEKVIRYYSFKGDLVLDPFAGLGTTGVAAVKLSRGFVLFEINPLYSREALARVSKALGAEASSEVLVIGDGVRS